jgi:hypothetical protein
MFATEPMLQPVREQYERRKWTPLLSRQKTGTAAARCTERRNSERRVEEMNAKRKGNRTEL